MSFRMARARLPSIAAIMREAAMASEYAGLPGAPAQKAREAATREEITVEELVPDAVESRLKHVEWVETLEFGERNARARALRPEDVAAEIAAVRLYRNG